MSQLTIDQALKMALRHREAGRLAEADGVYRQILAQISDRAEALHWLGLLACEAGHLDLAIDLIGRAIAVDPANGAYQSNLGECYRRAGQSEQAINCLRRATELAPVCSRRTSTWGSLSEDMGRLDEAVDSYRRAITLEPNYVEAHSALAATLFDARGPTRRSRRAWGRFGFGPTCRMSIPTWGMP